MRLIRTSHLLVWFRHILATGAAALVLGLGVAAANPTLHAQLHERGGDASAHDHSAPAEACGSLCAILLVGAGVEPATTVFVSVPATGEQRIAWMISGRPDIPVVRYLRHPERGPPQG